MPAIDNVTVARTFHEAWAERDPDKGATVTLIERIPSIIDISSHTKEFPNDG